MCLYNLNLFFFNSLKITVKMAKCQEKLEEKQANCLEKIKEKESQVKAKKNPGCNMVTQNSKTRT